MTTTAEQLIHAARAIVCDFDGTLVDSNAIKLGAFRTCFAEFPAQIDAIMAYCTSYHHTPRQVKFRCVYETILAQPYTEAIERALLARYAHATTEQVISAPEIPGASQFLAHCAQRVALALLSSTPDAVLQDIVQRRQWGHFFAEVRGAPVEKAQWLADYQRRRGYTTDELLFIGDTREDATSSAQADIPFLGVGETIATAGLSIPVIRDFTQCRFLD